MTELRPSSLVEIVQLSPCDWEVLRDLKLYSLQEEPVALENPETARQKYLDRPEAEWRNILSGKMSGGKEGETLMVFAREGEGYIGMISSIIPRGATEATIQHVYVKKDRQRRRGR